MNSRNKKEKSHIRWSGPFNKFLFNAPKKHYKAIKKYLLRHGTVWSVVEIIVEPFLVV